MARRFLVVCDGCDVERAMTDPDVLPSGWSFVTVGLSNFPSSWYAAKEVNTAGGGSKVNNWHLCSKCTQLLWERAHPPAWARMKGVKDGE